MIGRYVAAEGNRKPSHWIATVSVGDVDAAANAAVAKGGKVLDAPSDLPGVGRKARIADPQGAELGLLTDARGDKADTPATSGGWLWNELHTTEPTKALSFYEKVVGFSHRSMDMGPGEKYHILSRDGVDRGGVMGHLAAGTPPHWLPYVAVDDADATIAHARKLGARISVSPEDIPGIARFAILEDPTGAVLAIMKPLLREKQP
jgi:predicted enzyme related to lactoylglutathione lyase